MIKLAKIKYKYLQNTALSMMKHILLDATEKRSDILSSLDSNSMGAVVSEEEESSCGGCDMQAFDEKMDFIHDFVWDPRKKY